jgi:hypothetical protein
MSSKQLHAVSHLLSEQQRQELDIALRIPPTNQVSRTPCRPARQASRSVEPHSTYAIIKTASELLTIMTKLRDHEAKQHSSAPNALYEDAVLKARVA